MKRVAVTDLKNRLSEHLRLVKAGETIEILEHNVPIARIEPLREVGDRHKAALERLYREGLARPPAIPPEKGFFKAFFAAHPPVPCDVDAVQILIEQRGDR